MGAFLRSSFTHVDNVIPVIKTITWLLLSRFQGNKPHRNSPEPSDPSLRNLHQHAHVWQHGCLFFWRSGFAHVDNVITKRCSKQSHGCPCQGCKATNHTGTLRNLPNSASGTYTSTCRNSPELSGTLRNLPAFACGTYTSTQRNPPKPASGTFRNPVPEPPPATRTGTHRSLSGLKTPLAYAVGEK